ncbi:MAG TPA: glucose-6-phosphate dehydrogenase assembly protein OpcA [Ktedonobacteraceae bacterium]|nr:glucose-6-phosphate dehydrogenase assembly protein OpcA [Ktedonobacteraceae bacterium]
MANDLAGNPAIHLPWAGKKVRIEEIDTLLSSLWKMSADNMRIGANLNVRTSVLNLIICAPDTESAYRASKLLRDLSSTHIARATIVILDQRADAPDMLSSWVTLRCFSMISDLMRHCFEQTTLLISGRATRALKNILPVVLKAHLPVYLWWIGDMRGTDDTIFRDVVELCQRVIVDSATFLQSEEDIRTLATYGRITPQVAFSDLNWSRLTPWQQLVAQFFDAPEYLPFLEGVERIEIEHAAAPLASTGSTEAGETSPNPTAALLLASWLKARLNLCSLPESGQNRHDAATGTYQWLLKLPSSESLTILQIQPHIQADLRPGSIYLVRLICNSEGRRAVFTIKRDASTEHVLTSVEAAEETRPIRTVNLPDRYEDSKLLHKELEIMIHDEFFEQALQELASLLGQKET